MCHLPNSPLPNVPFRRMCILEECKKNSHKIWKVCHLPKVPFTKCFIYQMCLLTKCSVAFTKCTFFETPFRDIWKSILPPAENMRNLPFAKCDISRMCLLKLCLLKTVKKNSTSAENVRNMNFTECVFLMCLLGKLKRFLLRRQFRRCAIYQMCHLPSVPFAECAFKENSKKIFAFGGKCEKCAICQLRLLNKCVFWEILKFFYVPFTKCAL